jgi:hypothetical protein
MKRKIAPGEPLFSALLGTIGQRCLGVPVSLAQGLAGAKASDSADIEITPTGLGLHWPKLDADLYLPSLLQQQPAPRSVSRSKPVRSAEVERLAASVEGG